MSISFIVILGVLGLGFVAVLVMVVILIAISRKNDFVNPFPTKVEKPIPQGNVSPEIPKDIKPNIYFRPPDDREAAVVDYLIDQASAQTGVNLVGDQMVHQRMVNAVRIALQELETQESHTISMPFLTADSSGPKHFEFTLTRANVNQL